MTEQIIVAVIVGLIAGGFGTYVAVKVMSVELVNIKEKLVVVFRRIERIEQVFLNQLAEKQRIN